MSVCNVFKISNSAGYTFAEFLSSRLKNDLTVSIIPVPLRLLVDVFSDDDD